MRTIVFAGLCLSVAVGFFGCTKKSAPMEEPVPPGSIYRTNAEEVAVVEAVIDVPEKFRKQLSPLDRVLWDVKDSKGRVVANGLQAAEKFPFTIKITSRKLIAPLDPKSDLMIYARVVKAGDEHRPPLKGQLQGFLGVAANDIKEVVVPNVKASLLAKAEQKLGLSDNFKSVTIGSKAKVLLEPSLF